MTSATSDRILDRARAAQPAWAALTVSRRCAILGDLRHEIALQCESIADTIARETSKPLLDALSGDVLVTLEHLRYYENHAATHPAVHAASASLFSSFAVRASRHPSSRTAWL